jgi:hypothetical protein
MKTQKDVARGEENFEPATFFDIAGAKNSMDTDKLLGLFSREVRSKNTFLCTTSSRQFTGCAWRINCSCSYNMRVLSDFVVAVII